MRTVFIDFGLVFSGLVVFTCRGEFRREQVFFACAFRFLLRFPVGIAVCFVSFFFFPIQRERKRLTVSRNGIRASKLHLRFCSAKHFGYFFFRFPHSLQPGSFRSPAQSHKPVYSRQRHRDRPGLCPASERQSREPL